ncbi:MAG: hypothetical protein CMN72_14765 [Sphingomonas sp.]|mgnify:CR=1 FL=1|nr:hypothetical protein [Sphingomonas sp.]
MTVLSPALDAELAKDRVTIFGAVELRLAVKTIRLLDGSATMDLPAGRFEGGDPDYGVIDSIDEYSDGTGDEAPGFVFTMLPPSWEAALALSLPSDQGAPVRFWLGARDDLTGTVVGEPLLLAGAEVDLGTLNIGPGEHSVEIQCVSGMERFFDDEEGLDLSPESHKSFWPGELGCDHATGVADTVYWGQSQPSGVTR